MRLQFDRFVGSIKLWSFPELRVPSLTTLGHLQLDTTMESIVNFLPRSTIALISTTIALAILYCFSLTIYRLWFSPLSKFPGPRLAAITRYYEFYYDVWKDGQYTFKISKLHEVYGKTRLIFDRIGTR